MKKLTTTLLITTLAVGGLTIAGTSMARHGDGSSPCGSHGMQDRMHGHGHKKGSGHAGKESSAIMRLEKKLDLSEEQSSTIREIMDNARTARRAQHDIVKENRIALHDLVEAEEFNEQEARRLADIQADNMADMIFLKAKTRAAIRAQLSVAQREKLAASGKDHGYGKGSGKRW